MKLLTWWENRSEKDSILTEDRFDYWFNRMGGEVKEKDKPRKVIVFNGPPSSGKDTAVDMVEGSFEGVERFAFKNPLDEVCARILYLAQRRRGVTLQECRNFLEELNTPDKKEKSNPNLFNLSLRNFKILVSEDILKPVFGQDVFGKAVAQIAKHSEANYLVCSDGGFQEEVDELIKAFGSDNVLIVQLLREGTSFEHDSRNWVTNVESPWNVIKLENDNIEFFRRMVKTIAKEFFEL